MEILRHIVVYLHIIGFAVLFGSWLVEAVARRVRFTPLMTWGMVIALITGLVLAAPWPAGIEMNYTKLGVKLILLIVIGALLGIGGARQRKQKTLSPALFWIVGVLALVNAGIAVLWR
ncbi:MAG: Fe-S protein [Microbacterium sp.]|uniref:Fe-S protein n=1 Tax=Microbacterium sp. TaxID=51671 RepID=UPI003A892607